ncbi:MAG: pilus assembly protein [Alphaproteobacteria bacterium]|jgi:pilus assembly protein CpaC|nr:pilus assembly protein [Alphaproteobacteria bacterium]
MPQKKLKTRFFLNGSILFSLMVTPGFAQTHASSSPQPAPKAEAGKPPSSNAQPLQNLTAPTPSMPIPEAVLGEIQPSVAKNLMVGASNNGASAASGVGKEIGVATTKRIQLANHGTQVINLKQPAGQVLLTDPKVADVQLVTPSTLYVYGRSPGNTEIIVTGQDMQSAYRYEIHVVSDYRELESLIRGFAPNSNIKVHSVPDGLLLQGTVDSAKIAEDIRSLAQRYVGAQGAVVNQLKVKNSTQISLRVKIAEVKRTVVNQLGINWSTSPMQNLRFGLFTGRPNTVLDATTGRPTNFLPSTETPTPGSIGANFPTKFGHTDFSALIDALAQENLATVLAEPNLVTRSGEEASFLVGGEYPYPISQGTGANLTVSIQFKPYGISLSFVPVVIGDMISLRVRPEVSDLDRTITIEDQNGNNVPSIQTRRAESTMEMANGQSMIMAGLLSDQTAGTINNFPGLGDIPILGALFRSVEYQNAKTELVIIVTPYIVEPIDNPQDIILPTQGLKFAKLLDMILFNRLNDSTGTSPSPGLVGNAGFYF